MRKLGRLMYHDWPLHFVMVLTSWLPDNTVFLRLRGWLASFFFGSCGRDLRLGRNITFYNPSKIHLGSNIYLAYGCWIVAGGEIEIGDEVLFGPYCVVVSSNHSRNKGSYRYGSPTLEPVSIGRGSWLAAHVTVTSGSVIGSGVLVAAGSVVRGTLPDGVVAGGVPVKVLRRERDR